MAKGGYSRSARSANVHGPRSYAKERNLQREINNLESQLSALRGKVDVFIIEIEEEINSRPQHSNIGKKGCVKRLKKILKESTP